MSRIHALAAALLLCTPSLASQALAQEEASCTVFQGGTVQLPEGPREGFTVVVDGDRIVDLGSALQELEIREEGLATWRGRSCELVTLSAEAVLTPGLVQADCQLGLMEIGLEDRTRHHDAGGGEIRAAHDIADSYNPRSSLIPVARISGITSALISPTGGAVSGQAAWVSLAGGSQAETVDQRGAAMVARLATASPAEGIRRLRELFADARAWARDPRAFEQNRSRPFVAGPLHLEALQPVLRGDMPLLVPANRASDIEALIRFASQERIQLAIVGGAEAWLHAGALAEAGIAVIVDPLVYGPGSFDELEARPDGPALLAEAGVPVIISTRSAHFARGLRQLAGNAVRGGMDPTAALQAITSTPAQVFGLSDRGEIARGARADLAVWSGDPLELSSAVERLLIGGRTIELRSRQTELFERYRTLPGSPVPALPLPSP